MHHESARSLDFLNMFNPSPEPLMPLEAGLKPRVEKKEMAFQEASEPFRVWYLGL